MTKTLFLSFVLCLFFQQGYSQVFGETPPSTKWKQMNSPKFRIIYPTGLDSTANQVGNLIEAMAAPALSSIGTKQRKVSIVLRNKGIISNGYVSLAPFRSEFFLTPPSNPFELGSLPWPEMLALHEYRHVQQYNNFNVGLSHAMRMLFGEGGQALANAASVPDWFFEGDAVLTETNFSPQGRGSLPYFYNSFRSLWAGEKQYDWMKLRNGSYLDFVPNKYILGYMMAAYGRERYGDEFWRKVTHDAASFKSLFYPFQHAVRKHSSHSYRDFRDSALQYFQHQFQDTLYNQPVPDFLAWEEMPVYDSAGDLIYLYSSVKDIQHFVRKTRTGVKKIRVADYMVDSYFSYRNGKIVYSSRRFHPRWTSTAWNEIQLLDARTGKQRRVTKSTRYFSPDISESGDSIVAINRAVEGTVSLDLIGVYNGQVLKSFILPGCNNIYHPKFYAKSIVAAVATTDGRMSLVRIDISTGEAKPLISPSINVIGFPVIHRDTLFFTSAQQKKDELLAYSFADNKVFVVNADAPGVGRYHPAISDAALTWSTFTSQGMRLYTADRGHITYLEKPDSDTQPSFGLQHVQSERANLLSSPTTSTFPSRKYRQLSHPFNFHTLMPQGADPEYSLLLLGENILSTISSELSFTYNRADRSKTAGISMAYGGLFPILRFGYNFSFDRLLTYNDSSLYYNVSEPFIGFYVPLNFSSGRSLRYLMFGSDFKYNYRYIQKEYKRNFIHPSYTLFNNYLSFVLQRRQATAQVLPRLGNVVYLNYKFPAGTLAGYQYLVWDHIYLPGVMKTHSFNLRLAYSQRDTLNNIGFSNSFPFARGYQAANVHQMAGLQLNYQLPLVHPDKGFANIAYLLRVRSNLFFDQSMLRFPSRGVFVEKDFRSAGAEVLFDTRWWNQVLVSFGVRYSRLFDPDIWGGASSNRWELVLPVNLLNN